MLMASTALADIPTGYYTNAIGLKDEALMTALEGIIFNHSLLGYNPLWDYYPTTDGGSDGYYHCSDKNGRYMSGNALRDANDEAYDPYDEM